MHNIYTDTIYFCAVKYDIVKVKLQILTAFQKLFQTLKYSMEKSLEGIKTYIKLTVLHLTIRKRRIQYFQ